MVYWTLLNLTFIFNYTKKWFFCDNEEDEQNHKHINNFCKVAIEVSSKEALKYGNIMTAAILSYLKKYVLEELPWMS